MKSHHSLSAFSPGFTLLEVIVAMTILGIGVVTLLEIFSGGLRLGSRSSVATEAMTYGRQVMDKILLRQEIENGPQQGSLNERARWKLGIQPIRERVDLQSLSSDSTDWELKEIILELRVTDSGGERPVELRTLRLARKNR